MCEHYPDLIPVDLTKESLSERIMDDTGGWGVDRFFVMQWSSQGL